MAKDPAFLFYPGDYLRDTQCLSENSQVAYDRIMCEHMRNICISQKQLKFFTKKLSEDEVEELMMVLTEVEDGFQITWIAESISKRKAYSESRRKNRLKKNKEDMNNTSKTYDKHMENEDVIENVNKDESSFEKSEKLLFGLQDEFVKMVCDFFSQTQQVHKERVCSFINANGQDFVDQTNAYIEYKKLSGEKAHGWLGYQAEWNTTDWVDKLNKIKSVEVQEVSEVQKELSKYD